MKIQTPESAPGASSKPVGRQHDFTVVNTHDIYFPKKPIVTPSPEHLVQAGFGSPVMVTGLIDETTNNEFGGTIDNLLMERLQPYRALLGGESRKGTPLSVVSEDGRYSMAGGVPTFVPQRTPGSPPWETTDLGDGRTRIQIVGNTKEEVAKRAMHAARAQGLDPAAIVDLKAETVQEVPPQLVFGATLGGDGFLHAIAKSLFNLTAFTLTPQRVLGSSFDEIRAYVLDGVAAMRGKPRVAGVRELCMPNSRFDALATTGGKPSLLCSFSVRGSASTRCIYGLAVLYGHLPFSCLISDSWDGDDFAVRLAVDPHPLDPWWGLDPVPLEQMPSLSPHVFTAPRWTDEDTKRAHAGISDAIQSAVIWNAVSGHYKQGIEQGRSEEEAMRVACERVFQLKSSSRPMDPQQIHDLIRQEQQRLAARKRPPAPN